LLNSKGFLETQFLLIPQKKKLKIENKGDMVEREPRKREKVGKRKTRHLKESVRSFSDRHDTLLVAKV